MLASCRIRGSANDEAAAPTAPARIVPAGISDLALETAAFVGLRTISVSKLRHTNAMKPSVLPSRRLDGAGSAGAAASCVTMLRPADEAAVDWAFRSLTASGVCGAAQ